MPKTILSVMVTLLLVCVLTLPINVRRVKAEGAIYIMADGSIEGTEHIRTVDNVTYFLDANIEGYAEIRRDDIILDGNGYILEGFFGTTAGVDLHGRTNVTIQNLNVHNFWYGIHLENSSNVIISRCKITATWGFAISLESSSTNNLISRTSMVENSGGIGVLNSANNSVFENTITKSLGNAIVIGADDNRVSGNNITANGLWGVWLSSCSGNVVSGNDIGANSIGMKVESASNNTICHNNFKGNAQQVYIAPGVLDIWDQGYPSGGNYWSDYNGTDLHGGPFQNETGSDGRGDTPYTIDGNNTDRYPLMQPYVPILGDLNQDDTVDILDAVQAAECFGSVAGDLGWNQLADLNKDNIIDIFDMIRLAQNFGKTYP